MNREPRTREFRLSTYIMLVAVEFSLGVAFGISLDHLLGVLFK